MWTEDWIILKGSDFLKLSDTAYSILKWWGLIFLDALGICYRGIAAIWQLPFGDEVAVTCQVMSTFVGALIGVSTAEYNRMR